MAQSEVPQISVDFFNMSSFEDESLSVGVERQTKVMREATEVLNQGIRQYNELLHKANRMAMKHSEGEFNLHVEVDATDYVIAVGFDYDGIYHEIIVCDQGGRQIIRYLDKEIDTYPEVIAEDICRSVRGKLTGSDYENHAIRLVNF